MQPLPTIAALAILAAAIRGACRWYFPRRLLPGREGYTEEELAQLPPDVVTLEYTTSRGRRLAWYLPPSADAPAPITWVLFGGREARALRWFHHLDRRSMPGAALLAIEYPGYGGCPGRATPRHVHECADKALGALRQRSGAAPCARLAVAGYSIGAAFALQFALRHRVEKVLLFAPFSRLREILRKRHPLLPLILAPIGLDNVKAMEKLANNEAPPEILILHDRKDPFVPWAMAEELFAKADRRGRLLPVGNAGHDHLVREARPDVEQFMGA